jgi:release factor glutamine methyltransferase
MPETAVRAADLRAAFADAAMRLGASSPTPRLDARLLTMAAFGVTHETLVADAGRLASPEGLARLDFYLARRELGEPVSRILERREFYGRSFAVTPATLDPRADTETLVETALAALARMERRAPRILDLGAGSGAILVTLLAERPDATGVAVDNSFEALAVARRNATAHGVASRAVFVCGDWLDPVGASFDLVVANPPYIPTSDIAGLAPDVRLHDPLQALDGGADGLSAYREIASGLGAALAPGGEAIFEVGEGQAASVAAILAAAGLLAGEGAIHADLSGVDRCVAARRITEKKAWIRKVERLGSQP